MLCWADANVVSTHRLKIYCTRSREFKVTRQEFTGVGPMSEILNTRLAKRIGLIHVGYTTNV